MAKSFLVLALLGHIGYLFSNYQGVELAIKESNYLLVKKLMDNEHLSRAEKISLYNYADQIIIEREKAKKDRDFKVLVSIIFKCLPVGWGFFQILGYHWDQRGLILVLDPLLCVALYTLTQCFPEMGTQHPYVTSLLCVATAVSAMGTIELEKLIWKWAAQAKQKLQDDYENAVIIKEFLISVLAEV